jgi:hypothetical protein
MPTNREEERGAGNGNRREQRECSSVRKARRRDSNETSPTHPAPSRATSQVLNLRQSPSASAGEG